MTTSRLGKMERKSVDHADFVRLERLWKRWENLARNLETWAETERWEDTQKELRAVARTYRRAADQLKKQAAALRSDESFW